MEMITIWASQAYCVVAKYISNIDTSVHNLQILAKTYTKIKLSDKSGKNRTISALFALFFSTPGV